MKIIKICLKVDSLKAQIILLDPDLDSDRYRTPIRIQAGILIRIHPDPDPGHWFKQILRRPIFVNLLNLLLREKNLRRESYSTTNSWKPWNISVAKKRWYRYTPRYIMQLSLI